MYQNLMIQCINLGIGNADEEIRRVLRIVRMEDNASIKFKSCSLGMKQRIGPRRGTPRESLRKMHKKMHKKMHE